MGSIENKNIWQIDLIDRFLIYSKVKKSFSKEITFHFQLASLSIKSSIEIYSKRIYVLSI
jgi:hypothetical protein